MVFDTILKISVAMCKSFYNKYIILYYYSFSVCFFDCFVLSVGGSGDIMRGTLWGLDCKFLFFKGWKGIKGFILK